MKTKFYAIIIIAIFSLTANFSCTQGQNDLSDKQDLKMLKDFYTSYITLVSDGSIAKLQDLRAKNCTKRCLDSLYGKTSEELDSDPFIGAQDADKSWLKTLEVHKDQKKSGFYVVTYMDNNKYDGGLFEMRLKLMKQKGVFKIADVWDDGKK